MNLVSSDINRTDSLNDRPIVGEPVNVNRPRKRGETVMADKKTAKPKAQKLEKKNSPYIAKNLQGPGKLPS